MWDDFNDAYSDPHAPYWDAREVAALRSHQTDCSLIVGGYVRSVVTASLKSALPAALLPKSPLSRSFAHMFARSLTLLSSVIHINLESHD